MTRMQGIMISVALFAIGAGVEFFFEGPLARAVTVVFFFAFFVVGLMTVASPEFLAADDDEGEGP